LGPGDHPQSCTVDPAAAWGLEAYSMGDFAVGGLIYLCFFSVVYAVGRTVARVFKGRSESDGALKHFRRFLGSASILDRAWIAWGIVWTTAMLIAITAFNYAPFGHSYVSLHSIAYSWTIRDQERFLIVQDVMSFLTLWVGPILGGWVLACLVRWVANGRPNW